MKVRRAATAAKKGRDAIRVEGKSEWTVTSQNCFVTLERKTQNECVGAERRQKPLVRLPACHYSERDSGLRFDMLHRGGPIWAKLAYNETPVVIAQNIRYVPSQHQI